MVTVTYFTHATTTDNENGIATGWLPGELSVKGHMQAHELTQQASQYKFDVIFCSDLQRAIDSTNIAFHNLPVKQDSRLREANYGDLNGTPNTFKDHMTDYIDTPFPNGESYRDVEQRVREFCEMLSRDYDGKHVGIVSHQGPRLALNVILGGKNWQQVIDDEHQHGAWQPGWPYQIG
jgi:broad specificity phosphatase PhoE